MIVVHHLENSRSQRLLWLLEELGLDYEIVRYARDPKTMLAPPALRAIHPLGKSPVLVDGDVTVAESGAIVEYLLERYGEGRLQPPAGSESRRRYTFWMHYAEGSAMPPLLLKLVAQRMPLSAPRLARPLVRAVAGALQKSFVDPELARHLAYWESELGRSPWLAGDDFSAADIQMSFPFEAASQRAGAERSPRVVEFLRRIHARPAYQRALERGGPYSFAEAPGSASAERA